MHLLQCLKYQNMKWYTFFLSIIIVLSLSLGNGLAQSMKLQSRTFTDTSILLNYTDGVFVTIMELNRANKTICETSYNEVGKKYTQITYNPYHTEVGIYKAFDTLGKVYFTADNNSGTAYTITCNDRVTVLSKPKFVLDDESLLENCYGKAFVKEHILYLPNDYFKYGDLDTITRDLPIANYHRSSNYTKGFKLLLSNGNLIADFCVPFFYDVVTKKEKIVSCSNAIDFTKYSFCDSINYYYNKAKQFGLSKSKDYITQGFKTIACKGKDNIRCSGSIELNLIEILKFDTTGNNRRVVYNAYSFNPWTREFLGKRKTECTAEDFLFRVINFESEIYIHRFKDPLISRPKYLDDIIKFYQIDKYKYIVE
jgi:hypothetical protein